MPTGPARQGILSITNAYEELVSDRIDKAFRDSPSLKPYVANIFTDCYALARKKAAVETGLPTETFPEANPFSLEAALNPDFLPDT